MWSEAARQAAAEARKGKGSNAKASSSLMDAMMRTHLQASIARGHAMRSAGDGGHVSGFPSGGIPEPSNSAAARELSSGSSKSAPVPVHDGMNISPNDPRVGSRDYDAMGRPRDAASKSDYDEASRDMALRSRNGQIGSGMKFRG